MSYMFYKITLGADMKIGRRFKTIKQGETSMLHHLNSFKEAYSEKGKFRVDLIEVWRGKKLVKELEPVLINGEFVFRKIETLRFL
jgi:hypothetical protein